MNMRLTRPTNSKISNANGTEENLNPNIPSTTHKRKDEKISVPTATRTGVPPPTRTLQKPVVVSQRNGGGAKTNLPPSSLPSTEAFINTMAGMSDALNHISTMILSIQQNRTLVGLPSSLPQQPLTIKETDFNPAQCQEDLRQFSEKIHEMVKMNEELRYKYKLEIELLNSKISLAQTQLSDLESALRTLRTENYDHRTAIDMKSSELERINVEIKKTIHQKTQETKSKIDELTVQLNSMVDDYTEKIKSENTRLTIKKDLVTQRDEKIKLLKEEIRKHKDIIEGLEKRNKQDGSVRGRLYTTIQDLKGNIRVICRVRPLLNGESGDRLTFALSPNPQELLVTEMDTAGKRVGSYTFKFDRPFGADTTQEEVFQEVSNMVEEALNGVNCCIMAFGQKGSGRTYTMEGPLGTLDDTTSHGIIPQSACYLFEVIETLKTEWAYQIAISHLEIHNEVLCDMLSTEPEEDKILEIKQDEKLRKTWVANLTTVKVQNAESVVSLLRKVTEKCTNRTDTSRSHFLFQFHIVGKNLKTQETHEGYLNLITLASSDRDSGSIPNDIKKDGIHINSDLLCLNNVFVALVNHEKNVPYCSSKLTHLLQHSLGGNGKASMLATLSPSDNDVKESLNTLRFAAKINTYEIGTSKKPTKPKH